MNFIPEARRAH